MSIPLWKESARQIGLTEDHSNEVVFSLFDRTGMWSQPYRDAGYDVRCYDLAHGDDLVRFFPLADIMEAQECGKTIYGVLAAPPCTSFARSGGRWWATEHDIQCPDMVTRKYGAWASVYFDSPLEYAKTMVHVVTAFVEFAKPVAFHVIENPIGRIASVCGLGSPLLAFDPCDFGDPYTKRTQLYGDFNHLLPMHPVAPTEGSRSHKLRGDVPAQRDARSETPEGFSYAFFMANHGEPVRVQGNLFAEGMAA